MCNSLERKGDRSAPPAGAPAVGTYVAEGASRGDDLNAVLRISRSLAGKLDLPRVLGTALHVICETIGAEGTSILLIDPETGGMSFFIAEGRGTERVTSIPVPPGAGICGNVVRTGQCLIVNDAQNDPRLYRPVNRATGVVTRNLLCVPIHGQEKLWGVIEVINKAGGAPFDARDQRLAEVLAAETALALANARLHDEIVRKERMAAIGQTVSGLAHCIKNILNGIRSGSAVMDRAIGGRQMEQIETGWQTVRRNNQMLSTLVLDMLALARDAKPHPFPTDVNDLTEQVVELMRDRAAEGGIGLTCQAAGNLPEVLLDPTHFYRCLLNLVSNAIDAVDAADGAGRVRVRVLRGAGRDRFTVSITDNGQGIGPADRRKLFAEFFTTKGGKGTGLGLPVTKKLIAEMGGDIRFHSVPGRGTRFVLSLPIPDQTNPQQEIIS